MPDTATECNQSLNELPSALKCCQLVSRGCGAHTRCTDCRCVGGTFGNGVVSIHWIKMIMNLGTTTTTTTTRRSPNTTLCNVVWLKAWAYEGFRFSPSNAILPKLHLSIQVKNWIPFQRNGFQLITNRDFVQSKAYEPLSLTSPKIYWRLWLDCTHFMGLPFLSFPGSM